MQILSFDEDFLPRFSFEENRSRYRNRRRASSSCNIPISIPRAHSNGVSKSNLSYGKLPQQPIMLIIRKLDGSSFDVEVAMTATVAELKQAVEAVFYDTPKKGYGKISWSHVWGHFCLSYDGWKLVTDCEPIRNYGMRDGDQLTFTRNISITINFKRRCSKMCSSMSNRKSVNTKSEDSDDGDNEIDEKEPTKETEGDRNKQKQKRGKKRHMFRFGNIVGRRFSYQKINSQKSSGSTTTTTSCSSRLANGWFLKRFRSLFIRNNKHVDYLLLQ